MFGCSLMCILPAPVHTLSSILLPGGVWIRSGGLFSNRMYHEGSEPTVSQTTSASPHLSLAFTSGQLKMISAHGGQALAFAFYWKHRDLEQRIYQL